MQSSLVCKGLSQPCLPLSRCSSWPSTLCWCQLGLAWGAWQGTAGARASVNNAQWSHSCLTSVPARARSCHHLLPGWFGLLKWFWEYLRWRYHPPTVCGSPSLCWSKRTCKTAAVLTASSRRMKAIDHGGISKKFGSGIKEFKSFVLYRIKLRVNGG